MTTHFLGTSLDLHDGFEELLSGLLLSLEQLEGSLELVSELLVLGGLEGKLSLTLHFLFVTFDEGSVQLNNLLLKLYNETSNIRCQPVKQEKDYGPVRPTLKTLAKVI